MSASNSSNRNPGPWSTAGPGRRRPRARPLPFLEQVDRASEDIQQDTIVASKIDTALRPPVPTPPVCSSLAQPARTLTPGSVYEESTFQRESPVAALNAFLTNPTFGSRNSNGQFSTVSGTTSQCPTFRDSASQYPTFRTSASQYRHAGGFVSDTFNTSFESNATSLYEPSSSEIVMIQLQNPAFNLENMTEDQKKFHLQRGKPDRPVPLQRTADGRLTTIPIEHGSMKFASDLGQQRHGDLAMATQFFTLANDRRNGSKKPLEVMTQNTSQGFTAQKLKALVSSHEEFEFQPQSAGSGTFYASTIAAQDITRPESVLSGRTQYSSVACTEDMPFMSTRNIQSMHERATKRGEILDHPPPLAKFAIIIPDKTRTPGEVFVRPPLYTSGGRVRHPIPIMTPDGVQIDIGALISPHDPTPVGPVQVTFSRSISPDEKVVGKSTSGSMYLVGADTKEEIRRVQEAHQEYLVQSDVGVVDNTNVVEAVRTRVKPKLQISIPRMKTKDSWTQTDINHPHPDLMSPRDAALLNLAQHCEFDNACNHKNQHRVILSPSKTRFGSWCGNQSRPSTSNDSMKTVYEVHDFHRFRSMLHNQRENIEKDFTHLHDAVTTIFNHPSIDNNARKGVRNNLTSLLDKFETAKSKHDTLGTSVTYDPDFQAHVKALEELTRVYSTVIIRQLELYAELKRQYSFFPTINSFQSPKVSPESVNLGAEKWIPRGGLDMEGQEYIMQSCGHGVSYFTAPPSMEASPKFDGTRVPLDHTHDVNDHCPCDTGLSAVVGA